MIRTVRAATNSANTTSTIKTITAAIGGSFLLAHERGRAPDLDDLPALAGLDDLVLVVGPRGPHLAVDLDDADALVVGDPLQHEARAADQGGGARSHLCRLVQMPPGHRPHEREQQ